METSLKGSNKSFMWTRVLLVLLGIVALAWSVNILGFMVYFFAFFAIIGSIGTLAVGVSYSKEQLHAPRWVILILGILGLITGLAALASPIFIAVAIIYFIGVWALITGIADLVHAFSRVPEGNARLIMVVSGIVSLLFGLLVIFYPPLLTALVLVQVLGFYAILIGLLGVGYSMTSPAGEAATMAAA
jgi:uncharacterized membrane protein HdeD (DUF308 family)